MSKIIAFAGLDASGKTTQAKLLKKKLEKNGKSVFLCNPMHHPKHTKKLYSAGTKLKVDYEDYFGSEIVGILHLVDVWNYINNISKKCNKYDYIICERYFLDFYVYSPLLKSNLDFQKYNINAFSEPNIYIFLDITPQESKNRIKNRDEVKCRKSKFQSSARARELFLKEIQKYKNYKIVNAHNKSVNDIHAEIYNSLKTLNL